MGLVVHSVAQAGMKPVVVTDPHAGARPRRDRLDLPELVRVQGPGLLDEDVPAAAHRLEGEGRESGVQGGDDHRADPGIREDLGGVGHRGAARREAGEVGGAGGVEVAGV